MARDGDTSTVDAAEVGCWASRAPTSVRYIKLGEAGSWLRDCFEERCLRFTDLVPHEVAAAGDWDQARKIYSDAGRAKVADDVRELRDFYEQGEDCLWITFGQGRLWWVFADQEVRPRGDGLRIRRTQGPWSCLDAAGSELRVQELSTSLTQTAGYRRTICSIGAESYLLRRLNVEADPLSERLSGLQTRVLAEIETAISELHQRDFELLVDLIFARSGWRRVTAVGGSQQADTDLILHQPVTSEHAFVQVKSRAYPATLRDYVARFEDYPGMDRFFFACHSPVGRLEGPDDARLHVWLRPQLAAQAVEAGLVDWLVTKRR